MGRLEKSGKLGKIEEQENTGEIQENTGATEEITGRDQASGQFVKGCSGNPSGRPKGSLNKGTLAARALLENESAKIVNRLLGKATGVDGYYCPDAMDFCISHILPFRKGAPVYFDLPPITTIADVAKAQIALVNAVAEGVLTPQEGQTISVMTDRILKTLKEQNAESACEA